MYVEYSDVLPACAVLGQAWSQFCVPLLEIALNADHLEIVPLLSICRDVCVYGMFRELRLPRSTDSINIRFVSIRPVVVVKLTICV